MRHCQTAQIFVEEHENPIPAIHPNVFLFSETRPMLFSVRKMLFSVFRMREYVTLLFAVQSTQRCKHRMLENILEERFETHQLAGVVRESALA